MSIGRSGSRGRDDSRERGARGRPDERPHPSLIVLDHLDIANMAYEDYLEEYRYSKRPLLLRPTACILAIYNHMLITILTQVCFRIVQMRAHEEFMMMMHHQQMQRSGMMGGGYFPPGPAGGPPFHGGGGRGRGGYGGRGGRGGGRGRRQDMVY